MRILAINTAGRKPAVAMVIDGQAFGAWKAEAFEGLAASLPPVVAQIIAGHGIPELIAVCVGPGSFTGLRAGLALAAGLAAGYGIELVGVTQAEAFAIAAPDLAPRQLWTAIDSKRGRVFLDQGAGFSACDVSAIASPARSVTVAMAGDASIDVAAVLAARDVNVMLTQWQDAPPLAIAAAAMARHRGELPALAAEPMYIDPPAVTAPKIAAPGAAGVP